MRWVLLTFPFVKKKAEARAKQITSPRPSYEEVVVPAVGHLLQTCLNPDFELPNLSFLLLLSDEGVLVLVRP